MQTIEDNKQTYFYHYFVYNKSDVNRKVGCGAGFTDIELGKDINSFSLLKDKIWEHETSLNKNDHFIDVDFVGKL